MDTLAFLGFHWYDIFPHALFIALAGLLVFGVRVLARPPARTTGRIIP